MNARLILENGTQFEAKMFGACKDVVGEVIFTTNVVGYQEILTDPSYTGQIVTMTFPLIGNYGINLEDMASDSTGLTAIIVREKCDYPSNFRNEMTLEDFMKQHDVVGLEGIDTRALTRIIRNNGVMKGIITTKDMSEAETKAMFDSLDNSDVVKRVTTKEKYVINADGSHHVAVIDMGEKDTIIKTLKSKNYKVTVVPADTSAEDIKSLNPDMVFVSNGPGNPADNTETIETVKELAKEYPISGISLGYQVIALALGAKTEKLKFGHHGANYPVKDLNTGKAYITVQNHNYVVTDLPAELEATFENVNYKTLEGFKHKTLPIVGIQFQPKASPSDIDAGYLFDKLLKGVK